MVSLKLYILPLRELCSTEILFSACILVLITGTHEDSAMEIVTDSGSHAAANTTDSNYTSAATKANTNRH
jgi:hypothetical protein